MSTEEKAENICRSIGIAMYVQKEDADMQKENRAVSYTHLTLPTTSRV